MLFFQIRERRISKVQILIWRQALWFTIIVIFDIVAVIAAIYAPAKRIRNMEITATINEL